MTYETRPLPERYGWEILRTEVGSTLHGTGIPGQEDHDEMGVFIERPWSTVGLGKVEHYTWRSAAERSPMHLGPGRVVRESPRSTPEDTDLIVYSLRKWARLALTGNPSVLLVLFAPADKVLVANHYGRALRSHPEWFASKRAGKAFLGYMTQQRLRMTGQRGSAGRIRRQPESGQVDWKYAMHMLRLGFQGVEYLTTGRLVLPIPATQGDFLREVRRGEVPMDGVMRAAEELERTMAGLITTSTLPDQPMTDTVDRFIMESHLRVWEDQRSQYRAANRKPNAADAADSVVPPGRPSA